MKYCNHRYSVKRYSTREVQAGRVKIGGNNPICIQSMTTTNAEDIDGSVRQAILLEQAGCHMVRITAPNLAAAKALKAVREKLNQEKCFIPLVADIHFLPNVALEAVLHVEKIRINPGNYADKKKFNQKTYSDEDYEAELERLYTLFSPLVLKCKALGKAMRIGTNHGSLSDRIMNRYGDTPLGMVESAFEFIRIARSHGYHDLVLSMKASNPKIMIQAYRLAAAKMLEEFDEPYPLHLGVTEAGDGEDGRIKSAIGIGTLLNDGLGDTIRVSLTEDPIAEIPVAQALASKAEKLWADQTHIQPLASAETIDPFVYNRREAQLFNFRDIRVGANEPVRVILNALEALADVAHTVKTIYDLKVKYKEQPIEGLRIRFDNKHGVTAIQEVFKLLGHSIPLFWITVQSLSDMQAIHSCALDRCFDLVFEVQPHIVDCGLAIDWVQQVGAYLCIDGSINQLDPHLSGLKTGASRLIFTCTQKQAQTHAVGTYRQLAADLKQLNIPAPLCITLTLNHAIDAQDHSYTGVLLENSLVLGNLLCDGIGDLICIDMPITMEAALVLSYNILQGTRNRLSKTEFVACPSCGRTLFNLEQTTQKIRERTGHLKGVTIAVMGCIVNGPGEMADADFGYVGGAPGKVNLYVKKTVVEYNIPEEQAVEKLVDLIQKNGRWVEPQPDES